MHDTPPSYRSDVALSRRLERAEASANAAFVEARARVAPDSGATWQDVSGCYAMFDGVGSPSTQTFGLGLFAAASEEDLLTLERFFAERGADVFHEVSPLADPVLLTMLPARGYRPVELTSVLYRPVAAGEMPGAAGAVRARPIAAGEEERWADVSARGWGESPELSAFVRDLGLVSARSAGATCFLAELGGEAIAAGALALHGGVAILAGASTLPAWRGRGAQTALLAARLRHAAERGCDVAMMGALPGSTSQLNAERQGFRIAYTRLKWQRAG
jgi:GNAT superfamily N-acetyltransferase